MFRGNNNNSQWRIKFAMSLWKIAEFSLFFLLPFPRGRRKRKRRKKKKEGGRKVRRAKAVISEGKFVRRNEIIERRRSRIILAAYVLCIARPSVATSP